MSGASGSSGGGKGGSKGSGGGGGGGGGAGVGSAADGGASRKGPGTAPLQHDDVKRVQELQKKQIAPRTPAHKQVPLFAHLPQYEKESSLSAAAVAKGTIHPAVLRLGLHFAEGLVSGTNARVVGMLRAFQQVIRDFTPPPAKAFSRELDGMLKTQIQCAAESYNRAPEKLLAYSMLPAGAAACGCCCLRVLLPRDAARARTWRRERAHGCRGVPHAW